MLLGHALIYEWGLFLKWSSDRKYMQGDVLCLIIPFFVQIFLKTGLGGGATEEFQISSTLRRCFFICNKCTLIISFFGFEKILVKLEKVLEKLLRKDLF